MMYVHGVGWGLWAANMAFDGDGGLLHWLFLRHTQLTSLAPAALLGLTILTYNGYEDCSKLTANQFDGVTSSVD
jgi:hypothetical protein